jgi:hypothetical protein
LWQNVRSLDPLGFPWRWFGPASVAASLGAGLALGKLERPGLRRCAWLLLACGFGAGIWQVGGWRAPRASLDQPSLLPASYSGVWVTTTMLDEYLPVSVRKRPARPARQTFVCAEPARCSEGTRTAYHRSAVVETEERARVLVQSFAFPGWVVSVDGRPTVVEVLPSGSMAIAVEPGRHEVALDFQGTPLEHAALAASGLALVIALLVLLADVRAGPS